MYTKTKHRICKRKTRYIKENPEEGKDNLVPGTWINKKPEDDWYDYKTKKWANLYVESSGLESYFCMDAKMCI